MAKKRGRPKKSVLNQKVEEPKLDNLGVTEDGTAIHPDNFPKEDVVGWVQPEIEQSPEEIVESILEKKEEVISEPQEISLKVSGEKLYQAIQKNEESVTEEIDDDEDVDEEIIDETPRPVGLRALDKDVRKRMSSRELRLYQRTGILPK